MRRKFGAGRLLAPLPAVDEFQEVIANELLVEGILLATRLIGLGRPETPPSWLRAGRGIGMPI